MIGYHGTCSIHRANIEENGLDPAKCKYRDDHWLGQGVYFFDDYDKALWWASTISSQNGDCGGVIFKSDIEASDAEVLNLDDKRQLDSFMTEIMQVIEDAKKECLGQMPVFDGERVTRAVFFDYYKIHNNISVIIGTFQKEFAGYTTRRSSSERDLQKKIMDMIGIRFYERQICVSKKECIKSTKMIYNEEEEVV